MPSALFEDMDLREQEALDIAGDGIVEELASLLCPGPDDPTNDGIWVEGEEAAELPDDDVDEATAQEVAAGVAQAMQSVGVECDTVGEEEDGDRANAEEPLPPAPVELWRELGLVIGLGYVYDRTPRSVLRIQRGKPKNSVTVNCYKHPGCKLLLTEARCPADDVLKQWLYEVPPSSPGDKEEGRRLATQHMDLGRGRWGGRAKK